MKRLFILVIVGTLVIGASVATVADTSVGATGTPAALSPKVSWNVVNWIILYIPDNNPDDMNVGLGTVNSGYYDLNTGTWKPLTDNKNHNAYVITNDPQGYTLTVSATASSTPAADLTRFQIKGGDLIDWASLDTARTLKKGDAGDVGVTHIDNIQYEYLPSFNDAPGDYAVTVTYTVTAP